MALTQVRLIKKAYGIQSLRYHRWKEMLQNCFETSLIYPCSKFNYDQVVTIRSVKDGEVYLHGAALLNEKKPVHSTIDHCQIDHCA